MAPAKKTLLRMFGESVKPADVTPDIRKALAGVGVKLTSRLGNGMNGTAYRTSDNRCFKITGDEQEPKASAVIRDRGGSLRHVVRIFDVFSFHKAPGLHGIIQELLTPLSPIEMESFPSFEMVPVDDTWEETVRNLRGFNWEEEWFEACVNFSIDKMMTELDSIGISYYDYKAENVLKRGSVYVIADIGGCRVAHDAPIDEL
jgi:hypothetical protein